MKRPRGKRRRGTASALDGCDVDSSGSSNITLALGGGVNGTDDEVELQSCTIRPNRIHLPLDQSTIQ